VLGALAIIIAVLIVINSRADTQPQSPPPTVTDTGNPPATKTPTGSGTGQGLRIDWTDRSGAGHFGRDDAGRNGPTSSRAMEPAGAPLTPLNHASPARYETAQ
jgi:serine/threonine-protein kinase